VVLDQGQCGSCWAVSGTGVFTDRVCIWMDEQGNAIKDPKFFFGNRMFQKAGSCSGEGTTKLAHNHGCKRTGQTLSPQGVLSCGTVNEDALLYPDSAGCNGGEAVDAWKYFSVNGLTSMHADGSGGCTPYMAGRCSAKDPFNNGCRKCAGLLDECQDSGLPPKKFKVGSFGFIMEKGLKKRPDTSVERTESELSLVQNQVENMQIELMTNGPIHVCFDVYKNFGAFFNAQPNGIYNSTEGTPKEGGHCVEIVGWDSAVDSETGKKYDFWKIKNSWGPQWSNNGVFRFARGVDLCGIESDVWAGCPAGTNCKLTAGVHQMRIPEAAGIEEIEFDLEDTGARATTVLRGYFPKKKETKLPSQSWKGGNWHTVESKHYSYYLRQIVLAYEKLIGTEAFVTPEAALQHVSHIQTQVVGRGVHVRVSFKLGDETLSSLHLVHHHENVY